MGHVVYPGLADSVLDITDIVARSLNGLRSLQSHYNSADRLVAMTRGNLQSVKCALDEIREWVEGMTDATQTTYAKLLEKIEFAVQCCAIPLEGLCESIESLNSKKHGSELTRRGKLAVMLGETDLREMSMHLGNQVQALNLLLMAAYCKTQHDAIVVLQSEDTRSSLRQVEHDSASYVQSEIETMSVMTRRSALSDDHDLMESTFAFDGVILDSHAYRYLFETVIDERRRRRIETSSTRTSQDTLATGLPPAQLIRANTELHQRISPPVDHSFSRPGSSGSDFTIRRSVDDFRPENTSTSQRSVPSSKALSKSSVGDEIINDPLTRRRTAPNVIPITSNALGSKPRQKRKDTLDSKSEQQEKQGSKPSRARDPSLLSRLFPSGRSSSSLRNEEIERQLRLEQEERRKTFKVLVLGTSGSGKSTLLRQLKLIHEGPWSMDERAARREVIFNNAIMCMRCILQAMEDLELPLEKQSSEYHVQTIFTQPQEIEYDNLPPEVGLAIKELWTDQGVQGCYRRSREYHLETSAKYWFDNINRIAERGYIPTEEDSLRSRSKTTGIHETTLIVGEATYRLFDMGGTRSERRKWVHAFENVTAIIFTADISAYDQMLWEDETVNKIAETLAVFESICHSSWFVRATMILFLNKMDLFKDKLLAWPLQNTFPDYKGGADYEAACDYILNQFASLQQNENQKLYTFFSRDMDTDQLRGVMAAINDIIIEEHLRDSGFLF